MRKLRLVMTAIAALLMLMTVISCGPADDVSASDTETPSIVSELVAFDSTVTNLPFAINGGGDQGTSVSTHDKGYYTMTMKLQDAGVLTFGHVEVVRILKDETSTGVITFDKINQPGGTIDVAISADMENPLTVALAGTVENLPITDTMTVTASTPGYTEGVTYVWYINGESQDTGASYTTPSDLEEGVYNLGVTAFLVRVATLFPLLSSHGFPRLISL